MALLMLHYTERNDVLKSPAQRLFSRSTRSKLPINKTQLYPKVVQNVTEELSDLRLNQKKYFDKVAKPAVPLQVVDIARMQIGHRD